MNRREFFAATAATIAVAPLLGTIDPHASQPPYDDWMAVNCEALACFAVSNPRLPVTLYVDPVNGDDSNDGSQSHPVKSLPEAVIRLESYA